MTFWELDGGGVQEQNVDGDGNSDGNSLWEKFEKIWRLPVVD